MAQGELRSFPRTGLTVGTNASGSFWSKIYGSLRKSPEIYGKCNLGTAVTIR
jgi:hypothetical protein